LRKNIGQGMNSGRRYGAIGQARDEIEQPAQPGQINEMKRKRNYMNEDGDFHWSYREQDR
jgi:hypothetical protein